MKTCSIKRVFVIAFSMLATVNAFAAWETVDGITWQFHIVDGKATIGSGQYDKSAISTSTSGEIEVPSVLGGCQVSSISHSAFFECEYLTDVVIPDGVLGIGPCAFKKCRKIKSVKMPNSINYIGHEAFYACNSLEEVVISTNIINIARHTFYGCNSLKHIDIPSGVISIEERAFSGCAQLRVVNNSQSLEYIGDYAFGGCSLLEQIMIPNSVTNISENAFSLCEKLKLSWQRTVANLSLIGLVDGDGELTNQNLFAYNLTNQPKDRAIANLEIDGDMAIDPFVLKDGKVYDCAIRIVNRSGKEVKVKMPKGFVYEKFKGNNPLLIPAVSTNILTITRTKADTFLLSREKLELETEE